MDAIERLRLIAAALPSDSSAVTFTRADLAHLLEGSQAEIQPALNRDLSVEEVAAETGRAPSTVRGWLIAGQLCGYKLNGRDWRVTRAALRAYLDRQAPGADDNNPGEDVDITAWRRIRDAS